MSHVSTTSERGCLSNICRYWLRVNMCCIFRSSPKCQVFLWNMLLRGFESILEMQNGLSYTIWPHVKVVIITDSSASSSSRTRSICSCLEWTDWTDESDVLIRRPAAVTSVWFTELIWGAGRRGRDGCIWTPLQFKRGDKDNISLNTPLTFLKPE